MNTKKFFIISVLLILGILFVFIFQNFAKEKQTDLSVSTGVVDNEQEDYMHDMHQMFVTSEKDFIKKMIPHHEEAISTAQEVLERGATTDEIKELMNNIITAQTVEVQLMKDWYKTWFGEDYQDDGEYIPMMRELKDLSGVEIDKVFLEDMIMHHMGAIMMARSVQPYIENSEISELTKNVISTQSAEIVQMKEILANLEKGV